MHCRTLVYCRTLTTCSRSGQCRRQRAPAGAGANGGQNQAGAPAFSITIERIEVNAEGGDAQEIAANIADSLAQQVRSMVEQVDTRVRA